PGRGRARRPAGSCTRRGCRRASRACACARGAGGGRRDGTSAVRPCRRRPGSAAGPRTSSPADLYVDRWGERVHGDLSGGHGRRRHAGRRGQDQQQIGETLPLVLRQEPALDAVGGVAGTEPIQVGGTHAVTSEPAGGADSSRFSSGSVWLMSNTLIVRNIGRFFSVFSPVSPRSDLSSVGGTTHAPSSPCSPSVLRGLIGTEIRSPTDPLRT